MAHLTISRLFKRYGQVEVLKDVTLEIRSGEFVAFVGPSGCGKSTLLRCICGLEPISAGEIAIDGRVVNDLGPAKRGIAMVFQSYALYPHKSVYENMAYSLRLLRLPRNEIDDRVRVAADKLRLTDYLDRLPKALSGGQRQRVAIGRAIVRNPKVFLFDEPLSNLDAALRVQMRMEIARLNEDLPDTAMIYVTHDQVEAMTMADRIVVLKDGVIQQVGTPMELYDSPCNMFVARFIGSPRMNFLTGARAAPFGAQTVGVRPEHVEIGDARAPWAATIVHAEILGADSYLYADIGEDEPIIVREPGKTAHRVGETLRLAPKGRQYLLFDGAGVPLAH